MKLSDYQIAVDGEVLGAANEGMRQRALDEMAVLDTPREERFDRVTRLARHLFDVEGVVVTLIDRDREWFKSTAGAVAAPRGREIALCDVAMREPENLIVPDATLDPRFQNNPKVTGVVGNIRFYAAHPIAAPGGERIGALCIFDTTPRDFSDAEAKILRDLALWVEHELSLSEEMARASEVQRSLLPKAAMQLAGYDISGDCLAARGVGGDFFDWYLTDDGAAFTLADVMGKGIGAAIIAATARGVLRSGARTHDPAAAVNAASEVLSTDLDDSGTFVTLFHARLDAESGVMRYIDAGHGLTLVVRVDGTSERLAATSLPMGIFVGETWQEHRVTLEPGDTLISVSDGVLDLFDGSLAALDEVEKIVRSADSARAVVDSLITMAGRGAPDDVTLLMIRRDRSAPRL